MTDNKMDSSISYSLMKYKNEKKPGLNNLKHFLGIKSEVNNPKPSRMVIFISCDENADLSDLESHGIIINQKKGKVRTGLVPLDNINYLQQDQRINRIAASKKLLYKNDVAKTKVHVPAFINSTNLTGDGVLIGIVDSGIDPKHAAFKDKILRIWDQTLSGPGVREGKYGLELSDNLESSRDQVGHGSHVAGISTGSNNNNQFDGIALKSKLLIVKTDLEDAHISDGIRYIFRIAKELGKPCVCNLSLGGHHDPHDGTDDLSRIINEESGPGRIICCAAGNEGNDDIHSRKIILQNAIVPIKFRIPPISGDFMLIINCWYPGNDQFDIAIKSPTGFTTPFQSMNPNNEPLEYALSEGKVTILTPPPNDRNNDHNVLIIFDNSSGFNNIKEGIWQILVKGKNVSTSTGGNFDAWINDSTESIFFYKDSIDDSIKIGSPGCAENAITVGSFTTKVKWTDSSGGSQEVQLNEDDISSFSSEGPLRNRQNKPDLLAPGAMICSTLSSDSTVKPEDMVNEKYRIMAGTSMATPFVTGMIALMLEKKPSLSPNDAKEILKESCSIPGHGNGQYDIRWGYGLIDASKIIMPN